VSSTEFDTRMKQLEGRLEDAQGLVDSIRRVLGSIEEAHDTAERGSLVPLVLFAGSAIVAVAVVSIARRHQSV
jgi:hypothetical protein